MARLIPKDRRRFAQARRRGRRNAMRATAVVDARYNATRDLLELRHRNGKVCVVPRRHVPELDGVPTAILEFVTVSPAGDAISWRELDVHMSARGLRRFASWASTERRSSQS